MLSTQYNNTYLVYTHEVMLVMYVMYLYTLYSIHACNKVPISHVMDIYL